MTLVEAKRNAGEMNRTRSGSEHYMELEQAIEELDLERLSKILDEGTQGNK